MALIKSHSFFFQAEDGIRYLYVTGVQTCALPISPPALHVRRLLLGEVVLEGQSILPELPEERGGEDVDSDVPRGELETPLSGPAEAVRLAELPVLHDAE